MIYIDIPHSGLFTKCDVYICNRDTEGKKNFEC